ncbi:MAG TPA: hypothetical protein VL137_01980, partial [Polyangiaceae bacterium]|nr:hypothetical protein [Polyangiaceae bacterium]
MLKLLAILAGVLLFASSSIAQPAQFQTKAGVVVPVPAGFHEAQRDSLLIVNAPFVKQAEAVFQRLEG